MFKFSSVSAQVHNLVQLSCSAVCCQQLRALSQMAKKLSHYRTKSHAQKHLRDSRGITADDLISITALTSLLVFAKLH